MTAVAREVVAVRDDDSPDDPDQNSQARWARTLNPGPFRTWVGRGWSITKRHPLWALFPLAIGLLAALPIVEALGHEDVAVYPVGSFPGPIVDLWTVVAVPSDGFAVLLHPGAVAMLTLPVVVIGLFAGAYLGGLNDLLDHRRPSLWRNARQFGVPVALYTMLWGVAAAAVTAFLSLSLPAGAVAGVGFMTVTYRLWATPYLIVATGATLPEAFRRAWHLSGGPGPYRQLSAYVLATTLVLAAPRLYGVLIGTRIGLAVSAVVLAPVAMVLTVATLGFVRSLT
ncbi:MAG: hypothetical protein V5A34_05165 [Halapricum sp.]